MSKVLYFLTQCAIVILLGMAIVYTFYRADHVPNPDTAFLKTLAFWGICAAFTFVFWAFLALMKIKKQGILLFCVLVGAAMCWLIYGLMF